MTIALLCLSTMAASARPVRIWSHQELLTNSDFVAVLAADTISVSKDPSSSNPDPIMYQDYVAHCRVLSVFKGDHAIQNIDVPFFQHPDGRPGFNGAMPAPFTLNKGIEYLAYLKKAADGTWMPTAGTHDAALSIKSIRFMLDGRDLKLPERETAKPK